MYQAPAFAIIALSLAMILGAPLTAWIFTGSVDREMRPFLYRLWGVSLAFLLFGVYLWNL